MLGFVLGPRDTCKDLLKIPCTSHICGKIASLLQRRAFSAYIHPMHYETIDKIGKQHIMLTLFDNYWKSFPTIWNTQSSSQLCRIILLEIELFLLLSDFIAKNVCKCSCHSRNCLAAKVVCTRSFGQTFAGALGLWLVKYRLVTDWSRTCNHRSKTCTQYTFTDNIYLY